MAQTVLAARLTGPDRVLRVEETKQGPPAADEVVIDMMYASINPLDTYVLAGQVASDAPVPRTLGVEGVGRRGDDLFVVHGHGVGLSRDGTWSQRTVVPSGSLIRVPEGVDPVQAACAAVCGRTAIRVVYELAEVTAEDRVLVLGATGGVGTAATSLALSAGATVWGQTGDPSKAEAVAEMGAETVIARSPDELIMATKELGVNVVLDPLGGNYTTAAAQLLAPYGTLVIYGASSSAQTELDVRSFYRRNIRALGYGGVMEGHDEVRSGISGALRALADGNMRIPVSDRVPLSALPAVLTPERRRDAIGKTIVDVGLA
jgi:NADPH2:quinone reductase